MSLHPLDFVNLTAERISPLTNQKRHHILFGSRLDSESVARNEAFGLAYGLSRREAPHSIKDFGSPIHRDLLSFFRSDVVAEMGGR